MAEMMQRREEWNVCHMTDLCFITVLPYWDGSWKVGNFRWSRECIEKTRRQFKSLNRLTSLGGLWGLVRSVNKHQRFRLSLIFDSLNVQSVGKLSWEFEASSRFRNEVQSVLCSETAILTNDETRPFPIFYLCANIVNEIIFDCFHRHLSERHSSFFKKFISADKPFLLIKMQHLQNSCRLGHAVLIQLSNLNWKQNQKLDKPPTSKLHYSFSFSILSDWNHENIFKLDEHSLFEFKPRSLTPIRADPSLPSWPQKKSFKF